MGGQGGGESKKSGQRRKGKNMGGRHAVTPGTGKKGRERAKLCALVLKKKKKKAKLHYHLRGGGWTKLEGGRVNNSWEQNKEKL